MIEENNFLEITKPFHFEGNEVGIILVHGFTGSPHDLRPLGEYLADKGFTVAGVRLSGHGVHHEVLKKTNRFDWYYSLKMVADDLRKKVKKIYIVGFSMGGNLSLLFTKLEGGVSGLVLINTPIFTKPGRLIFWFIPLIKNFKKFTTKKWAKNMDNYFEKMDQGTYLRIPLDSAWQYYKLVQETKEILPEIEIPVYIIQSTKDKVINFQSADYLFRRIKSQDKKIEYVETDEHKIIANFPGQESIFNKVNIYIKEKAGWIQPSNANPV
ncbi:MAG: alpha/beta fold hydrolase [Patescibacteria group bacterium]